MTTKNGYRLIRKKGQYLQGPIWLLHSFITHGQASFSKSFNNPFKTAFLNFRAKNFRRKIIRIILLAKLLKRFQRRQSFFENV